MLSTQLFSNLKAFALKSPLALSGFIFLLLVSGIKYVLNRPKRLSFPIVGRNVDSELKDDLVKGTLMYPDTPFIIPSSPPKVILPICVIDEFRNLPENQASFNKLVQRHFAYKQTGIGDDRPELIKAVKVDLTRHIAGILDDLQDEIKYSMDKEFGKCDEWTSITLYSKLARVVALLSGRVFVGLPLSRNEEWIDATIQYTGDCVAASQVVKKWNRFLWPFVASFLPEIKKLHYYKARGGQLLGPIVREKLARPRAEKTKSLGSEEEEQGACISWILGHTKENERWDPEVLAGNQMTLSFAAIHTTTMATTQAVYDLVCRPEYFKPLLEEIDQIISEDGYDLGGDGLKKLKKSSIPKLRKLDSFLKESQRLSPPGLISNARLTTSDIKLSTGHTIPKGTEVSFAAWAIHTSALSSTFSPSNNPPNSKPPAEFDGFRFSALRSMEGKENKHQFVTTSTESLNFGHGNHACPGRFFASNEIKVVMIELLRHWELRLKGDVERVGGEEKRPESFVNDMTVMPNPFVEIEFRRKVVAI